MKFWTSLIRASVLGVTVASAPAPAQTPDRITETPVDPKMVADDDFARHATHDWSWASATRFSLSENGYDWTFYRLVNRAKPDGPIWIVLHDNENPAFDSAVRALKSLGGTALIVSTKGAARNHPGGAKSRRGLLCHAQTVPPACDPNRNFGKQSPSFSQVIASAIRPGQPVIAIHTNEPHPRGTVSMMSANGSPKPGARPRPPGSAAPMDWDTLIYLPVMRASVAPPFETPCGRALAAAKVNILYEAIPSDERDSQYDGSLSHWLTIQHPTVRFFNLEAPWTSGQDMAAASARHAALLASVTSQCVATP